MAKKSEDDTVELYSGKPGIKRPRLNKLTIKNFRCIGKKPVIIDLDEIVVLVGKNNVGKSSILKAYEIIMSQGSNKGLLSIDDFPNSIIDEENLPEIELETIIYENTPGEQWIAIIENGEMLIKERWIWNKENEQPKREGWNIITKEWSNQVPWGAPNVANSRRPLPHRIDAFAQPETQAAEIKTILLAILTNRIKELKNEEGENTYKKLLETVTNFQKEIVSETKNHVKRIEEELTKAIKEVFDDYKILFDAKAEDELDMSKLFFKAGTELLMGPEDGYLSKIEYQGSGARRTLIWNALKIIEEEKTKSTRPHVLLLDEPEICLHPNAIRDACNVLYDLPVKANWQVIVTTHSPIFIDISRDNTTIINVDINKEGEVHGTTVFKPSKVKLEIEDKANLKLLNIFDPYVSEFFFGGKTIIVEGDTEYTAFKYIISKKPDSYKNIHIIRARGKATIISLIKILNHFGGNYSVLHDSDKPLNNNGKRNSAWSLNEQIKNESKKIEKGYTNRILASIPNFEEAYFTKTVNVEKPYTALTKMEKDEELFTTIENILIALLEYDKPTPNNCIEYVDNSELESKVT